MSGEGPELVRHAAPDLGMGKGFAPDQHIFIVFHDHSLEERGTGAPASGKDKYWALATCPRLRGDSGKRIAQTSGQVRPIASLARHHVPRAKRTGQASQGMLDAHIHIN